MKFLVRIPAVKDYETLPQVRADQFIWQDRSTDLIRLISPVAFPWQQIWVLVPRFQKGKGDNSDYVTRIDFKLFETGDEEAIPARIERRRYKSKLAYTPLTSLFNVDVPTEERVWITYIFTQK